MTSYSKIMTTIILFFLLLFIAYQHISHQDEIKALKDAYAYVPSTPDITNESQIPFPPNESNSQMLPLIENIPVPNPTPDLIAPLRTFDYRALNDPLTPPLRRMDWTLPIIPVPTRGFPTAYKKVGTLIANDCEPDNPHKFLVLMGRQKFPSATYYDYYVTENRQDSYLKFILENVHKELFTGDEVYVKEFGRTYKVHMDKELGYEYIPYVV